MLLWLWNYLRGYVTIEIRGFSAERFLNMAVHRGVYVWNASRTASGVQINVSVKGFKRLKGIARKTKSKVIIRQKHGWPFVMFRYRKRKLLMGGAVFFILALYALSSFIWKIEINGNERLTQEEILNFAEGRGLSAGAFKYLVSQKKLQRELMAAFPDISWADVHIKGTRAVITLAEIIPKQNIIDKNAPCDIIAAKDGLITGIVTGAGRPLVRQNDVVKEGELLVSGMLEYADETGAAGRNGFVRAYAEVWAKRYTSLTFSIPYEYTVKAYTGKTKSRYAVQFLFAGGRGFNLPGSSVTYGNYDKITHRGQPGVSGDYPLPVILITTEYSEFIPEPRARSVEEAVELAERMITGRIIREFDFQADIIDKKVSYEELPDSLLVAALITTNERIDKAVPINGAVSDGLR